MCFVFVFAALLEYAAVNYSYWGRKSSRLGKRKVNEEGWPVTNGEMACPEDAEGAPDWRVPKALIEVSLSGEEDNREGPRGVGRDCNLSEGHRPEEAVESSALAVSSTRRGFHRRARLSALCPSADGPLHVDPPSESSGQVSESFFGVQGQETSRRGQGQGSSAAGLSAQIRQESEGSLTLLESPRREHHRQAFPHRLSPLFYHLQVRHSDMAKGCSVFYWGYYTMLQ